MLIGSTAEFYWLNYEDIHIVGCPMYMENYVKIIIRARKHPSNFSVFLPLFPGPSLSLRFRGSLIPFCSVQRRRGSNHPPSRFTPAAHKSPQSTSPGKLRKD